MAVYLAGFFGHHYTAIDIVYTDLGYTCITGDIDIQEILCRIRIHTHNRCIVIYFFHTCSAYIYIDDPGSEVIAAMSIATGIPLHWTKGVVVGSDCESTGEDHLCLVELVPDGAHVKAKSGTEIVSGEFVELRVWVNPISNRSDYKVVR